MVHKHPWQRLLTLAIYALSALIGVVAFAYPFFMPAAQMTAEAAAGAAFRLGDAPLLTLLLLVLCLVVLLIEVQGQAVSAKVVAALGILVAVTSALRFLEVAIPGPGGFSPIFAPIILAGYVFGARFGFLMGAMTLLASALITGGVGPWLPYQMFTAGWVGLTAGWLPHFSGERLTLFLLIAFSFVWGFLYGAVMNLYFWPFIIGEAGLTWQAGAGWRSGIGHYAAFYVATSLLWDLIRALGNALLMAAIALPVTRALSRFRDRFQLVVVE